MATASSPTRMQAWWSHRQGLDGSLRGTTPAQVLERTGWARSVGGVGPYLTLFSRAGTSRDAADLAVANLQIHELPSARGCTYVVPAGDFPLALALGRYAGDAEQRTARSLGVTDSEIDVLCAAVLAALTSGALDPDGLRSAVGGLTRSLGEAGKKKGVTTTLPVALGRLQAEGEIRRVPSNGRLDQQRYRYVRWQPNLLRLHPMSAEQAHRELGRRFFTQVGPATPAEFQWFSGLGVKVVKDVVQDLGLVACESGSDRLLPPELADAFARFQVPDSPRFVLVSSLDPLSANRRNVTTLLAPEDQKQQANQPADLPRDVKARSTASTTSLRRKGLSTLAKATLAR